MSNFLEQRKLEESQRIEKREQAKRIELAKKEQRELDTPLTRLTTHKVSNETTRPSVRPLARPSLKKIVGKNTQSRSRSPSRPQSRPQSRPRSPTSTPIKYVTYQSIGKQNLATMKRKGGRTKRKTSSKKICKYIHCKYAIAKGNRKYCRKHGN
jgi:hypothetical protein